MTRQTEQNNVYVIDLQGSDPLKLWFAGGKGANLAELSRIAGIQVPEGFCLTTAAYDEITSENRELWVLLDELAGLKAEERQAISLLGKKIRTIIEETPAPADIAAAVGARVDRFGKGTAFAVRSSATAEDQPTASFAGQQDTYLNVIGKEAVLTHISRCWASLFTDRAIIYRLQNDFDHRGVRLAVVVQRMVFPQASGILFTADPVTSSRKTLSIDAGFGLGEAMVSGLVNADSYRVRGDKITGKMVAVKKLAVHALKEGGTAERELAPELQTAQVLTDEQILQLATTGRKIEHHFGCPQDIEWCLADGVFHIVQSRPVTTLFPVPLTNDGQNHVFVSVGHQQMMTDAMRPLGLSVKQLTAFRPMYEAAGRLFVDVAPQMATAAGRKNIIGVMGQHDPLIKDALITIAGRADFIPVLPDDGEDRGTVKSSSGKSSADILERIGNDPAIVAGLIGRSEASVAALRERIQSRSGEELFDFIREDIRRLKQLLADPQSMGVIMAAIDATVWLNENLEAWLGEKNVADTLSLSAPGNITSEMGRELMDVADTIRPYPEVIAFLQQATADNLPDELLKFDGGIEARAAICAYLDKYGMRCAGEIDITRMRWSERPAALIPMILSNIKNFGPGAGKQKFEQGLQRALQMEQALLKRLRRLPGGEQMAMEAGQMISLLRNFIGYREYPKYSIVCHYFVYRQALLQEAAKLAAAGIIHDEGDIYYLTFDELRETVRTRKADHNLISCRKKQHAADEKLTPPRVITSDGEIITGSYKHEDLPAGAIAGLAVSSGVVAGRARVVLNIEDANLEDGDILVTTFTDPSWTPLFVAIKGLVAEVGGLMTHGAVIAREYGLPAVVGVEGATGLIRDGQRIRVNGTDGYVEIL